MLVVSCDHNVGNNLSSQYLEQGNKKLSTVTAIYHMLQIDQKELSNLYLVERLSIQKIADMFECNRKTIYRALDAFSIPKRSPKCDLVNNKKFGKWTVVKSSKGTGNDVATSTVKCKCGNTSIIQTHSLIQGKSTQCRDCCYKSKRRGYKEISAKYWYNIKASAKKRNIPFKIEIKDAWELFISQNKTCALTGHILKFGNPQTASLDRIDSTKPYILENLQWTHKTINKMKTNLPQEVFVSFCKMVSNHNEEAK